MRLYPWLDSDYNRILDFYRKGRGHHALLLDSKWDNGEDLLIDVIVRWLYCISPHGTQYCNICYDCKLMNIGHHPDYYKLSSDNNVQVIGVDTVRVCVDAIYKHAYRNRIKIVFIKYVEHLTDSAVNVLLKVLDEPPINTYFFFKTEDYMRVPSTFLSRCMRWTVSPPEESLGLQWLMQRNVVLEEVLAKCALRLFGGAPIEAEFMFKSGAWEKRLELCKTVNDVILNGDFLKLVPFLKNIYKKNRAYYLYWFITMLVDALKWKHGVKRIFIVNVDQIELITIIANSKNILSLSRQVQQWLILWHYFQKFTNLDHELLLTYRLLNWKQDIIESCYY